MMNLLNNKQFKYSVFNNIYTFSLGKEILVCELQEGCVHLQ